MEKWIKELMAKLTVDLLPEEFQELAALIGLDHALQLSEYLGGSRIYYPRLTALLRPLRDAQIKAEFTGANHRELARRYELSEQQVRNILRKHSPK